MWKLSSATGFAFKTYTNNNQDKCPKEHTYGLFLYRKGRVFLRRGLHFTHQNLTQVVSRLAAGSFTKNNYRVCAASWGCKRVKYRILGNLKISGKIQNSIACKKYVLALLSNKKKIPIKAENIEGNYTKSLMKCTTLLQFLVLFKIFFFNCSKPSIWNFSIIIFISLLQSRELLCISHFIF